MVYLSRTGRPPLSFVLLAQTVCFFCICSFPDVADSDRLSPGIWSYSCGGAAYDGTHPEGFYEAVCNHQNFVEPPDTIRGHFALFYWADLEPENGVFNFDTIDSNLTALAATGLQMQPIVFIAAKNATPYWVYDAGVPKVVYHSGGNDHTNANGVSPYFLNPLFQSLFSRFINALAQHFAALPAHLLSHVWVLQAAMGITGDSRPYDGVLVNASYDIDSAQWISYCRTMIQVFLDAFQGTGISLLANMENPKYNQSDDAWFLRRATEQGFVGSAVKEGIVSHGYQLNGERELYETFAIPILLTPNPDGTFNRCRGELALEPDPRPGQYGNWAVSPWWSLRANAEWCLTFGIDVWNLYAGFTSNSTFAATLDFFNRHAGHKNASTSPAAFISFRDSLDTSDVERFPVDTYGPVNDSARQGHVNDTRMLKIVADFAQFGARIDDIEEASCKKSICQKKGQHLNDVCWRCWPGNYGRYLTQVSPLNTSVGWWRVGSKSEAYGRFARGLHHETGRESIKLKLDPAFGTEGRAVQVQVAYFDSGTGTWELLHDGTPVLVQDKKASNTWKIASANFSLKSQRDFVLQSKDREDDVFSLMEVLLL